MPGRPKCRGRGVFARIFVHLGCAQEGYLTLIGPRGSDGPQMKQIQAAVLLLGSQYRLRRFAIASPEWDNRRGCYIALG